MIFSGVSADSFSGNQVFTNTAPQSEEDNSTDSAVTENTGKKSLSEIIATLQQQTEENTVSNGAPVSSGAAPAPVPVKETIRSNQGTVKIDSVQITGLEDQESRRILNLLEGLKLDYFSLDEAPSRFGFNVSLSDTSILSYSIQNGSPYYVSSSFLGNNTYMIYDSDQFEEKLVTACYDAMERMSPDSTSQLPPLDTVLTAISAYREQKNMTQTGMPEITLTEEIDPTALLEWFVSIADRFVPAEPEQMPKYRYTDMAASQAAYQWPKQDLLPAPAAGTSSFTAVFLGEDITGLLDAFIRFFNDNPELAGAVNQAIAMQIQDSMMEVSDGDYVTAILSELKENLKESLQDLAITLKMDMTENGDLCYAWLQLADISGASPSGAELSYIFTQGDIQVFDFAIDIFAEGETMPLVRELVTGTADGIGKQTINILIGDTTDIFFEYAQTINNLKSGFDASITDTDIDFLLSDFSGKLSILSTAAPNEFDSSNTFSQISLRLFYEGMTAASINATIENRAGEPIPLLTPEDAIPASNLTSLNYDQLAVSIFTQVMMLAMSFS